MKFKKIEFIILLLFFLPQTSLPNDNLEYNLYCTQFLEGSPFGLVFKNNEVVQIEIENFQKILDYKEIYSIKGNYFFYIA